MRKTAVIILLLSVVTLRVFAEDRTVTLTVSGVERKFMVHTPPKEGIWPVVINMHGQECPSALQQEWSSATPWS